MGEGHGTGGKDHQHAEHSLDTFETEGVGLALATADAALAPDTQAHQRQAKEHRDQQTLERSKVQAHVLEALGQGHHGDDETHQEHVHRHIALGSGERVVGFEHQTLHRLEQHETDGARKQRRDDPAGGDLAHLSPAHRLDAEPGQGKTDDGTDDGMGGGHRPALHRSDQQPGAGGQQRGQHAVDQELGVVFQKGRIDDALADGFGDLATGQPGTEKFKDDGDDDRLLDGDRP